MQEILQFEERDSSILEVGCGAGRVLKLLKEMNFADVMGIEKSNVMSAHIFMPEVLNMDIFDYNIEHDIILCVFSLHLLGDLREALTHLSTITKSKLLIATIDYDALAQTTVARLFPETLQYDWNRFFPISKAEDILRDCNFQVTHRVAYSYSFPVPIDKFCHALKLRYISALNYVSDARIDQVFVNS